MGKRDKQIHRDGNGSSNGQNAPSGNGGEGRSGRLSQIKNHKGPGDEVLNEFISGEDLYDH